MSKHYFVRAIVLMLLVLTIASGCTKGNTDVQKSDKTDDTGSSYVVEYLDENEGVTDGEVDDDYSGYGIEFTEPPKKSDNTDPVGKR